MSKAVFYRIPVKHRVVTHAPRRRQRPLAVDGSRDPRESETHGPAARPTYHAAPQFRRNRRFWLRWRAKEPR